jgi:hypothetical protein
LVAGTLEVVALVEAQVSILVALQWADSMAAERAIPLAHTPCTAVLSL